VNWQGVLKQKGVKQTDVKQMDIKQGLYVLQWVKVDFFPCDVPQMLIRGIWLHSFFTLVLDGG
jgi:hypothetical protein